MQKKVDRKVEEHPHTKRIGVLFPLYQWPTPTVLRETWLPIVKAHIAHPEVPLVVVVNPRNGPGDGRLPHSNYCTAVKALTNAGVTVIGYVRCAWGDRPIEDVERDVELYEGWGYLEPQMQLAGILFDEAPNTWQNASDPAKLAYFRRLYQRVKQSDKWRGSRPLVVLNPGSHTDEQYLNPHLPATDVVVLFENYFSTAAKFPDAPYWAHVQWDTSHDPGRHTYSPEEHLGQPEDRLVVSRHHPSQLAALVYECPDVDSMRRAVDLAIERNLGWIFVTDDSFDDMNPWDRLPSYWPHFMSYAHHVNHAPSVQRARDPQPQHHHRLPSNHSPSPHLL